MLMRLCCFAFLMIFFFVFLSKTVLKEDQNTFFQKVYLHDIKLFRNYKMFFLLLLFCA